MRRTHVVALLLVLVIGLLAAGCLDGTETTATPDEVVGTLPESTTTTGGDQAALEGDAAAGKAVFTTSCGGCHTLADAGTTGNIGPNLDDAMPPAELVVDRVTNGKGNMPVLGLEPQQIADVAAYVSQSAGG